jgi:hypothetical protein
VLACAGFVASADNGVFELQAGGSGLHRNLPVFG